MALPAADLVVLDGLRAGEHEARGRRLRLSVHGEEALNHLAVGAAVLDQQLAQVVHGAQLRHDLGALAGDQDELARLERGRKRERGLIFSDEL